MIALSTVPSVVSAPVAPSCFRPAAAQVPALWIAAALPVHGEPTSDATLADPSAPLDLWRADDGLFYVDGVINGAPVRFVVDTGASMIVLKASDARRAKIATDTNAGSVEAETAGGKRTLARVTLASMQVGATGVTGAPAVVADDSLSVSLLGQSWLAQLASVTIEGDRMRLRP
ncbi:MAG: TIGR02281 family clan AA aspartic protease [Sphingomonadaceae bacterium]